MENLKYINNIVLGLVAILVIIGAFVLGGKSTSPTFSGAPSGLTATLATSSMLTTSNLVVTAFATSSGCASRVVTTTSKPIMLTFGDNQGQASPSGLYGHYQAASTTVVYDAGLYGCGLVKVYGYDAIASTTVSEFR